MDELKELSHELLRLHDREYRRYFLETKPFGSRLSVLIGQRGVGKTTAITQYLKEKAGGSVFTKDILYVQADHFLVKSRSLYEIAEAFARNEGKIICFDEIHKYRDWSLELKSIYDTFPQLQIIASGSSILEIKRGSHDLSRRAIVYKMFGMSFREFIEMELKVKLSAHTLDDLVSNHSSIAAAVLKTVGDAGRMVLPLFSEYVRAGYYPFFYEYEDKKHFYLALGQNVNTTIEVDILAVHPTLTGNSVKKIVKLLSALSQNVPYIPDMRKLRMILELGDERTLKIYLKLLEDAGIITQLWKTGSELRQLEKPEKIYMNNPTLMHAVCARDAINPGNLRETFFLNAVSPLHKVAYSGVGDFEVDRKLVFEVGGKSKSSHQLRRAKKGYLAVDDIEIGSGNRIPLWLFGFLY